MALCLILSGGAEKQNHREPELEMTRKDVEKIRKGAESIGMFSEV